MVVSNKEQLGKAVIEDKKLNKVAQGNVSNDEEWKRLELLREEREDTFLNDSDDMNLPNPIEKKGYKRRYFNEENTQKALKNYWRFVNIEEAGLETDIPGSIVTIKVGYKPSGEPHYAQLMEKPEAWYHADRRKRIYNAVDEKMGKLKSQGGDFKSKDSAISTSLNLQARESKIGPKKD